jgi:hypothetical protein
VSAEYQKLVFCQVFFLDFFKIFISKKIDKISDIDNVSTPTSDNMTILFSDNVGTFSLDNASTLASDNAKNNLFMSSSSHR